MEKPQETIRFRATSAFKAEIEAKAKTLQMSLSQYIRYMLTKSAK